MEPLDPPDSFESGRSLPLVGHSRELGDFQLRAVSAEVEPCRLLNQSTAPLPMSIVRRGLCGCGQVAMRAVHICIAQSAVHEISL